MLCVKIEGGWLWHATDSPTSSARNRFSYHFCAQPILLPLLHATDSPTSTYGTQKNSPTSSVPTLTTSKQSSRKSAADATITRSATCQPLHTFTLFDTLFPMRPATCQPVSTFTPNLSLTFFNAKDSWGWRHEEQRGGRGTRYKQRAGIEPPGATSCTELRATSKRNELGEGAWSNEVGATKSCERVGQGARSKSQTELQHGAPTNGPTTKPKPLPLSSSKHF